MISALTKNKSKSVDYNDDFFCELPFTDVTYLEYLKTENGGYYFNNSLHFFGLSIINFNHSIDFINKKIKSLYGDLIKDYIVIGEDVFGNLFCVDNNNIYYLFNIETGDFDSIENSFSSFLNTILEDIDYYTGYNFIELFNDYNIELLGNGFRFCPKYPFVLGGDYDLDNLVLKSNGENLDFSSSIYHQIKDLPDGSEFNIKIL